MPAVVRKERPLQAQRRASQPFPPARFSTAALSQIAAWGGERSCAKLLADGSYADEAPLQLQSARGGVDVLSQDRSASRNVQSCSNFDVLRKASFTQLNTGHRVHQPVKQVRARRMKHIPGNYGFWRKRPRQSRDDRTRANQIFYCWSQTAVLPALTCRNNCKNTNPNHVHSLFRDSGGVAQTTSENGFSLCGERDVRPVWGRENQTGSLGDVLECRGRQAEPRSLVQAFARELRISTIGFLLSGFAILKRERKNMRPIRTGYVNACRK